MVLASSRTPQRRRRSVNGLVATAGALLALAGCSGGSPAEQPSAEPVASSTPWEDYDTSGITLVRGEFCGRVPPGAVTAALGSDAAETASWQPGRRLPDSRDLSNEFGCSWTTPSVTARAWVFAPPITRARAGDLARELVGTKCEELSETPALGEPGVAQRCRLNTGSTLTGFYGLVGDAWVGCEVGGLSDAEPARVGEWCVAVLEAMRAA